MSFGRRKVSKRVKMGPTVEWERGKRMPSGKNLILLEAIYHRLISDIYYELRKEALEVIKENKRKYGPDGLGIPIEQPP